MLLQMHFLVSLKLKDLQLHTLVIIRSLYLQLDQHEQVDYAIICFRKHLEDRDKSIEF